MTTTTTSRVSTGIPGLDEMLHGGFIAGRTYLVSGGPGTGKTTLGLQFLGNEGLFICMHQSEAHDRADANSMGIVPAGITFLDLARDGKVFSQMHTYGIL